MSRNRRRGRGRRCSPRITPLAICASLLSVACLLPAAAQASPFVYTANRGGTVSQFNAAGGALSALTPPFVTAGGSPEAVAVRPDGRSVYVVAQSGNAIYQYSVADDGTLSAKSPASVLTGPLTPNPVAMAITPNGRNAYVTNLVAGTVSQYSIASDGTLSPKTPATVSVFSAYGVAVSPNGQSAYVTGYTNPGSISQFTIAANGTLVAKTPPTVVAGNGPVAVAVNPDGLSALALNLQGDSISQYAVTGNGTLTALAPAAISTGHHPQSLAFRPGGRSVYVTAPDSVQVLQYTVSTAGALTAMPTPSVAAGNQPYGVAVAPDGLSAYVTDVLGGQNKLYQFSIADDGSLSARIPAAVGTGALPTGVAVGPASFGSPPGQDNTFPAVSILAPADGARYVRGQVVKASYSCTDPDGASDIASCAGPVASGGGIDTGSVGPKTFTVSSADIAGNAVVKSVHYTVTAPTPPVTKLVAASVSGSRLTLTLACTGSTAQICTGTATLTSHVRLRGKTPIGVSARKTAKPRRTVKLLVDASSKFAVSAGHRAVRTLTLNAAARKLLSRFHRLPATVTVNRGAVRKVTFTSKPKHKKTAKH
jgi:6-phosphogluconolactonase (cycloisomerase 2 family)